MKRMTVICVAGFAIAACSGSDKTSESSGSPASATPPAQSDVDTALAVRRGLDAAPDKADSVLAANGLTAAGLDSLMYRIAADSTKRAAFGAGR